MSALGVVLAEAAITMRSAEGLIADLLALGPMQPDAEKLSLARNSMRRLLSYADKLEGVGIGLREGAESADAEFQRTLRSLSGR